MVTPEISVATTKAYNMQHMTSYLLALKFAITLGRIHDEQYKNLLNELKVKPEKIESDLEKERLQWFEAKYANLRDVFFIGRGIDYVGYILENNQQLNRV